MASTVAPLPSPGEVRRSDVSRVTAKADVRFSDEPVIHARKQQVGAWLDAARYALGWNLDELALALHKDARQVKRWIDGIDSVQLHAVVAVPALHREFVIAQARGLDACEVTTHIQIRRFA